MCISQEAVEFMCAAWTEVTTDELEKIIESPLNQPIAASCSIQFSAAQINQLTQQQSSPVQPELFDYKKSA